MSERLRESVSALMDGEADELELRRLLGSDSFAVARETWIDFQRARGSLNGIDAAIAGLDISARVQTVIADEQLPKSSVRFGSSLMGSSQIGSSQIASWRWWRPVASVAVAASMAAVVVMGMRGFSVQTAAPLGVASSPTVAAAPSVAVNATDTGISPNAGRVFSPTPLPMRNGGGSSTVSATYGSSLPGNIVVPVQVYGTAQSRADAEALARKRLQQYLLMQVEHSAAAQSTAAQQPNP